MTDLYKETCTVVRDEKDDRLLPHQIRRPRLTAREKNPRKHQATERKALQTKGAKFRAVTIFWKKTVMWILASSRVSKLQVWDYMQIWKNMFLQTCWGWWEAQQEVKERWCERISCIIEGVYTIGLCVSRFLSEKVCSTWRRAIGIKTRRQILQGHLAPNKNSGKKGSIAGIIQKCEPHERSPCAPKFGKVTWGDLAPRKMRPQSSMGFGETIFTSSGMRTQLRFTLLLKQV